MPIVEKNDNQFQNPYLHRMEYSKRFRVKYELQRFANQMFIEQNAFYKVDASGLKEQRPKKGYRSVGKARKQMRAIKNSITKEDPRWQPKKFMLDDVHDDIDRYVASKYLQDAYRRNNTKELIKDLLHNSLMKSSGYRQIFRDGEDVSILELDGFDVYLDPHGWLRGPKFQGRWMIKAIPSPTDVVNRKRPGHNFSSDNKIAESPQKVTLTNNLETTQKSAEFGTIMVYEIYVRECPMMKVTKVDEEGNEMVDKDGNVIEEDVMTSREQIKKVIVINDQEVETEWLDMEEFPIIVYQPERFAGRIYPSAWVDPIIEMNKSINRMYTDLEDRVHSFAKGRWLAKRDEDISNISDENGQIVYYDNVPPSYMQQGSPGDAPFRTLSLAEQFSDDAGGVHAESTGSTSGANIRSSSQIMQMQAGDIQNMAEPLDNLRSFMSVAGEMILEIASKNMIKARKVVVHGKEYKIRGSQITDSMAKITIPNQQEDPDKLEIKGVKPFKNLVVDIIPGTAYSDMQVKQDLIDLKNAGVQIPDEILLDAFKIGDTQEILAKMKMQAEKDRNPDIDIATAENKKMAMGQEVMADITDNHLIHKAIHAQFLEGAQSNMELAKRIIEHIKQHEAFERPAGMPATPGAMPGETPSPEGATPPPTM